MIRPSISIKGKIASTANLKGNTNMSIITPTLEEIEVVPKAEQQELISEKDGFSKVIVAGDEDLKPENIKSGVSIFGVDGTSVNTEDATAVAANIDNGIIAYSKNDERIVGKGRLLNDEVIYTTPYTNKQSGTGKGEVISIKNYIPLVYNPFSGVGGDFGETQLFPTSKFPIDVTGKNIMFRIYFKNPTYSGSSKYYLRAELYVAPSMDNEFALTRDSSRDGVKCYNGGERVSYTYYIFEKYLGDYKYGTVPEGTIDDITPDGWTTGTTTYRDTYSPSSTSMYKFSSKDMRTTSGLTGMSGYVGRGDDCFLRTVFGKDIGTYGGDYKIKPGGTLISRIPNEDVAKAIGLTPDKLKAGETILGVEGNLEHYDNAAVLPDMIEAGASYNSGINRAITKVVGKMSIQGTNADYLFGYCTSLKEIPLLDTSNVTNMNNMFLYCMSLEEIPLLDTSNVTNMENMFTNCTSLETIPELNTSKTVNMEGMFRICTSLETIPLLDTSNVTNMKNMFRGCTSLKIIPLLDTSKVSRMNYTFYDCTSLETIPLLDTSNVTNMENMFTNCTSLETIPLLDTSNVTSMYEMFKNCISLKEIPLLDTSKVTNMYYMFYMCKLLKEIPLLNTSKVTNMYAMFYHCESLEAIPKLDTSQVTNMSGMLSYCPKLTEESLNNILAMCINAVKITSASSKTLKSIGLTSAQAEICATLSNYEAFIAAGWKTGY